MSTAARRVLIVDDEEALLHSLAAALRERGHKVKTALNGFEALEILQDKTCDLVVTDLRMPGLDGSSLITELLDNGHTSRVIVVTGYATLDGAIDCLRRGAFDFLVKPFETSAFLQSVDRALERPGLPEARPAGVDWDCLQKEFDLTRRQATTLRALYTTGESNRELAAHLFLSQDTVKSHLRIAFHKLGISNRAQFFRLINDRLRR